MSGWTTSRADVQPSHSAPAVGSSAPTYGRTGSSEAGSHEPARRESVHDNQLGGHEPPRDLIAEFGPDPLRWPKYRRQRFDQHDNTDEAGRDPLGPELFDEAHLCADP
jgi:hypothetical protein